LQRQDWGEAIDVSDFYGRTAELNFEAMDCAGQLPLGNAIGHGWNGKPFGCETGRTGAG